MGYKLRWLLDGTDRLTWRDLLVIVRHLPLDAAINTYDDDHYGQWSLTNMLLAQAVDALNGANWQRGGGKGERPKPVQRPGVEETSYDDDDTSVFGGDETTTVDDLNSWLGWDSPAGDE